MSDVLPSPWCFWLMHQPPQSHSNLKNSWTASQSNITTINTSSQFWQLFNTIHLPSKLSHADYSLFRLGISPAWEDPACKSGGRWILKAASDEIFFQALAAMLCEEFSHHVLGAVFSARTGRVKLALWLATSDEEIVLDIGNKFKAVVTNLESDATQASSVITFESFAQTGDSLLKL